MRHFIVVSSCLLLALLSLGVDASGGGRLPVPIKRPCVGTCCQTRGSINRARFCSTQLALFAGGDTVAAATITSSLVSSLRTVTKQVGSKRNSTACIWRDRLSQIGADFTSLKYFFQDEEVVTVGNKDFPMSGSGAVFTAGTAVYLVFSGVDSPNNYTKRVRDIEVDGKTVQVMAQFYNYYQLYTDDTDSIIEEAIDQYKALPDKSSGKRLFIIGHSAGGSVALYAALDLADAGYVADEVYVFGASKPGYKNFVDAYLDTELGDKTTVWWNELDVEPVLPTKNARQTTQIKNNQPKDDDQEVVSWGSDPKYARLPGSNYWRIAPPSNIKDTAPGTCVKVESDSDVWYDPCPAEDADPNNFKCGLTWLDHPSDIYHKNIKACALEDYNKGHKVPTRGEFNPTCITDLVV